MPTIEIVPDLERDCERLRRDVVAAEDRLHDIAEWARVRGVEPPQAAAYMAGEALRRANERYALALDMLETVRGAVTA